MPLVGGIVLIGISKWDPEVKTIFFHWIGLSNYPSGASFAKISNQF